MYALAILRYRKPLEEVLKVVDAHRAYLAELKRQGVLLASGPFEPRIGGGLLLHDLAGDNEKEELYPLLLGRLGIVP